MVDWKTIVYWLLHCFYQEWRSRLNAGQEREEGQLEGFRHTQLVQVRDVEDRRNGPASLVDDVAQLLLRRSCRIWVESRKVENVSGKLFEMMKDCRADVSGKCLTRISGDEDSRPETEFVVMLIVHLERKHKIRIFWRFNQTLYLERIWIEW